MDMNVLVKMVDELTKFDEDIQKKNRINAEAIINTLETEFK